jgi:lysophospholipase L1-like esterase
VINYTYLALGDSYTIGESVLPEERWSAQLTNLLKEADRNVTNPDIIARTGWTTAELIAAIEASRNTNTYDLVSLLIGVNNQYRGQPVETYTTEFAALLDTAIHFTGGNSARVFVLSIPDWGVTPFAARHNRKKIAREIDRFNQEASRLCMQKRIAFVDVTFVSRTAQDDPRLIASDGLHFSGAMYRQWARLALPVVTALLA